jgi:hypothetical protein
MTAGDSTPSLLGVSIYSAVAVVVVTILVIVVLHFNTKGSRKVSQRIAAEEPQKKTKERRKIDGSFDITEVALHNTEKDCWIIVDGKVYDVTGICDSSPLFALQLSFLMLIICYTYIRLHPRPPRGRFHP